MIPFWEPPSIDVFGFEVAAFGLLVGLGMWVGVLLCRRVVAAAGYDPDPFWEILILSVAAVVLGGHLGHIFMYEPEQLVGEGQRFAAMFSAFAELRAPDEMPNLLQMRSGLSSYGGFIAALVFGIVWVKWRKPPVFPYLDAASYGFTASWTFARVGCFVTHDHPGSDTDFVLGVLGTCPGDATLACHPLGLYEAFWALAMFVAFTALLRTPRHPGFVFGWMLVTYGPTRLLLDVFRHPAGDARYLGLTPAQYLSAVVFLVGVAVLWRQRDKPPMRGDWVPSASG
jgi:phosphatidylglycerol:prolipoprotein diacylglycerol transferase